MYQKLSMIVAMSTNRCIGKDNQLLWDLPEDMKWFRNQTSGRPVVMGHKTHQSIGRLLPNRQNIILSRNKELVIPGALVLNSVEEVLKLAEVMDDMIVIGGENIYKIFLPYSNLIMRTTVNAVIEGDAFFPDVDDDFYPFATSYFEKDERHFADLKFEVLLRKQGSDS
ncbi:dihydrofolate reductase [Vibrio phage pTD1]|uniref:dihydrofolate reductase n=1 Tax=Vibrio phage pTD1 TaxID=1938577 RepID=A0A1Q2U372_9CAUD|nr:dihydrofolate reductase [Vibrio phage pTD1]BAW98387.1 dihydrofolate reductase [Vibrio phage pTD1]